MAVDYGEDFLQRIVGVHWRTPVSAEGGVFIGIDLDSNIHYLRIGPGARKDDKTGLPVWKNLGPLDYLKDNGVTTSGAAIGCSYAVVDHEGSTEPVFVLVGGGNSGGVRGIIMASSDGLTWQTVYTAPGDVDTVYLSTIFAVVWDEIDKAFYAGAHQFVTGPSSHSEIDILLRSSNGYSWGEVDRFEMVTSSGPVPEYNTGLLASHCSKRVVDSYGNGLPDGFYKYDSVSKIMIAPTALPTIFYFEGAVGMPGDAAGVTVTKFAVDERPLPPSSTDIPTYCVAGIGESWMAGGGLLSSHGGPSCQASYLAPSVEEGGMRWLPLNPSSNQPITTMIGGQAKAPPL